MSIIKDYIASTSSGYGETLKTPAQWKAVLSRVMSGRYSTKQYRINPGILYRARINKARAGNKINFFAHVDELWAPRAKYASKQRCNVRGQNMFYCSSHPMTTLFELAPASLDEMTIMVYEVFQSLEPVCAIGVGEISKVGPDVAKVFAKHYLKMSQESKEIDDDLAYIFRLQASSILDVDKLYTITNAITSLYLNNQKDVWGIGNEKIPPAIGLLYPSVQTVMTGINYALKPMVAKRILKPVEAYKYVIHERVDTHHYHMFCIAKASVLQNGQLVWKNFPDSEIKFEAITDLPT